MKLTANVFDTTTGELLPVYRDAYLRGDLARSSAQAVEDYLHRDAGEAHSVVTGRQHLQIDATADVAPSWVRKQLRFVHQPPSRFRRRALSFGVVSLLLAGASMAATHLPTDKLPAAAMSVALAGLSLNSEAAPAIETAELSKTSTLVLHGRILNEKGEPLAGATVLQKGTTHGTSTDANGNYSLRVPTGTQATLQYSYGSYNEQEMRVASPTNAAPVVLQPKPARRQHWLLF